MTTHIATIEQTSKDVWVAAADGLTGTGPTYSTATEALAQALYARDGVEPRIRRDRTEVPVPGEAERTPQRLMELLEEESPQDAGWWRALLEEARGRDAQPSSGEEARGPYAVTAWCVEATRAIVGARVRRAQGGGAAQTPRPQDAPDPRASSDPFLATWLPPELDTLEELTAAGTDVPPRTLAGIMDALPHHARSQAWAELTHAPHGPELDRAAAHWWKTAVLAGVPLMTRIMRSEETEPGPPTADRAAFRALQDVADQLTETEQAAMRREEERSSLALERWQQAMEDAYIGDLERLLEAARTGHENGQRWRWARQKAHAAGGQAVVLRDRPDLLERLRQGRPFRMVVPARSAVGKAPGHPYVFWCGDQVECGRVAAVATYGRVEEWREAGEDEDPSALYCPWDAEELASSAAAWRGLAVLLIEPREGTGRQPGPRAGGRGRRVPHA